ncbi:MAG: aromatic ring-hydroxylating dioxygenase subunit alpha [Deltaproteobacteria bacterium]|nr:aromatic ring-hydroxylating dioxygenase subunit alpha [Deltaproteobacteria bacterium]
MNRATSIGITRRLIAHVVADTTDLAEAPRIESAECFLDPGRWEREREQFFFDTPQAIGFAGQVAEPGSYMTAEVMDVPVLVTRDREGVLRAFRNVCAHRGARIASGCGKRARLTCRFHGWSYGLDGKLAGRGSGSAFEPDLVSTALQALPVSDRAGLIVVGLRPEMGSLRVEHALDDIAPALEGHGLEEMIFVASDRFEVAANWKLVVNLSHEGYHFATLHRDSLAPMMSGHGVVDEFGLHTRWAFPLRGIENLREKDEADWPDFPPAAVNHTLFPGTVIVANQGNAQMIRVEPGGRPQSSVIYFSSVSEGSEVSDAARATYEFGRGIFEGEDLPIAVECQRGIEAGKRPVVVGRNEPVVQLWHRRWEEELS